MNAAGPILLVTLTFHGAPPDEAPKAEPADAAFLTAMTGPHLCGDHWNGYNEVCTVSRDDDGALKLKSEGPSTVLEGTVKVLSPDSFELHGKVEVRDLPIGLEDLTLCDPGGPYVFKRTGKRRYFRHVRTCEDMTTYYFDVFLAKLDDAAVNKRTKKLSELKGRTLLLSPLVAGDLGCEPVNDVTLRKRAGGKEKAAAVACGRRNQHGYGNHGYYSCDIEHPLEKESLSEDVDVRLLVFDKPKHCTTLLEALRSR